MPIATQRRVALVRPRQTFDRWTLDDAVCTGSCVNVIGWLHERSVDGMLLQRKFFVPNTLIFHQGGLAAWFFSSKQNGALLCKHRRHLTADTVVQAFGGPSEGKQERSAKKVALLFRGANDPVRYLSLGELQIYLEHKSISDSQSATAIVQLPTDPSEEFDILKVSWMNGHSLVEARTASAFPQRGVSERIETRMRALDSFINEFSPIRCMNQSLSYRDVEETWVGPKLQERLHVVMSSIVRHIENLQPKRIKKLSCMFRLGPHNHLSYLFPLSLETIELDPPKALIDAVAVTDFQPRWTSRRLVVPKTVSQQMLESFKGGRGELDEFEVDLEKQPARRTLAKGASPGKLPRLPQGRPSSPTGRSASRSSSSHHLMNNAKPPTKPALAPAEEANAKGHQGREPSSAPRSAKLPPSKKRLRPRPPAQPRPQGGAATPVRRLLRAYGSSKSARRIESWLKRKRERSRRYLAQQNLPDANGGHRAFLDKLHAKLKNDLMRQLARNAAETLVRAAVRQASAAVVVQRVSTTYVPQTTQLTAEERDALLSALGGIDSAMTRCLMFHY